MSTGQHRNRMPTYFLQWEAILAGKQAGCQVYDLWGAPDEFAEEDSMWGVYRFKQGLGGEVLRTIGAWDKPLRPLVFQVVCPRLAADHGSAAGTRPFKDQAGSGRRMIDESSR